MKLSLYIHGTIFLEQTKGYPGIGRNDGKGECSTLKEYFKGYYLKHQKGGNTLCLIIGQSGGERFIQVITGEFSMKIPFTEGNYFGVNGVSLQICVSGLSLSGRIRYQELSPIQYDIMGPFRFFPMECRHGIISMNHRLCGKVALNGKSIDFTGGKGYIEMDSGSSFPSSYAWIQANDFPKDISIMAAVATIPFYYCTFPGCICVIMYQGREYRFATYLGVKVLCCTKKRIVLRQGRYQLDIRIHGEGGMCLHAPIRGSMTRMIRENAACPAEFIFSEGKKQIFHLYSQYASFEFEAG